MDFLELAKERYSVRKMKPEKIKQEDLNKILEAARLSPTAKNLQRERLLVIDTEEGIEKIKQCTSCDFGASTIIVISYEKDDEQYESENSRKYGLIDTGIVATHMCLEATDLGLGTTMVGLFDRELTKKLFNIPAKYQPELLLPIGYIDRKPSRLHEDRKPIEELVKYNKY
jgi:nitroreductase